MPRYAHLGRRARRVSVPQVRGGWAWVLLVPRLKLSRRGRWWQSRGTPDPGDRLQCLTGVAGVDADRAGYAVGAQFAPLDHPANGDRREVEVFSGLIDRPHWIGCHCDGTPWAR